MSDGVWKEIEATVIATLDLVQYGMFQMIKNPMVLVSMIVLLVVQNNNLELQIGKLFKAKA